MYTAAAFWGLFAFFMGWICYAGIVEKVKWVIVVFGIITGASLYQVYNYTRPEYLAKVVAEQKADEEFDRQQRTPHLYKEVDGCKIYTWKTGYTPSDTQWHYVTRCPNSQVTTERNYEVCTTGPKNQKTCKSKQEVIETK